jgi:ribosome biogenesis protein Nip4
VGRTELMSLGTCFGKFTKSRKFKLHVTCLDHISQYAKVSHARTRELLEPQAVELLKPVRHRLLVRSRTHVCLFAVQGVGEARS